MSNVLERLREALAGRYSVDSEIGGVMLARSRFFTLLLALGLPACSSSDPPDWPSVYRFAGTITSAATGEPIAGAQFAILWSTGAFGDGGRGTEADEVGQYYLEHDFQGPIDCEGIAVVADAAGYEERFFDPGRVRCTSDVQTFDFQLVPLP